MFKVVLAASGLIIFFAMIKTHKIVKAILFSALCGASALFAVNFIGGFIGVHIPVNAFSGAVVSLGGIPGAVFLLVTEILCLVF